MVLLLHEIVLPSPQLPHFFCTVFVALPVRLDLRPGLVENEALGLLLVTFLPDQFPALTISTASGLVALAQGGGGNTGSATPFCRSPTVSARCHRRAQKLWAELAEQGPCYTSSTSPTAPPSPTLPLGFTPTRGPLRLCWPRLKRRTLPPSRRVCLWEAAGAGSGVLLVSAIDPLGINPGSVVGQNSDILAGGSGYLRCFVGLSFPCACYSPGLALCRIKHCKDIFFLRSKGFCVCHCNCNCSTEIKY